MENIKKKIKAIIFDMDGTIIKTEHIWHQVTIDALHKFGVKEITKDIEAMLNTLAGVAMVDTAQILKKELKLQHSTEEILRHKLEIANNIFAERCEFIDGFEDFHKKIQQYAIPNGIATNAHPENLKGIIQVMNLDKFFGHNIYSIGDVSKPKPDPELFLHVANKLGVYPNECIVFEDSEPGFKAANAAGMKCIAVKSDKNESLLHHVDDAIESYHDAIEVLKKV